MNVHVAVLCDAATDDNGKMNLLGAFDTIYTQQLPAIHPQCSVALRVTFSSEDEGQHQFRVNFVDADGRSVMPGIEIPLQIALPEDAYFITRNFIINIQQLKFKETGLYSIDISFDSNPAFGIPLVVKQHQKPAAA